MSEHDERNAVLMEALRDAEYALLSAHRMFAAICETDGSADRRKARDSAWQAYCHVRDARNAAAPAALRSDSSTETKP